MKKPDFAEGVAVALVAGLIASAAYTVLPGLFGSAWTTRALVAGLGLGYVLYLLSRSPERTGRIVTLAGWLAVSALAWLLIAPPLSYLAVHIGMAWLVRSLFHQPGPLTALADLALHILALAAGSWAYLHGDSVFLGVWSFFLVQALFTGIPSTVGRSARDSAGEEQTADRFRHAYQSACTALRALSRDH